MVGTGGTGDVEGALDVVLALEFVEAELLRRGKLNCGMESRDIVLEKGDMSHRSCRSETTERVLVVD